MFCVYLHSFHNTAKSYHSRDHNDFRPNIFLCIEKVHETDEIHSQCQAVQHAGPDKVLPIQRKPQNDRGKKEKVHQEVKAVPHAAIPASNLVPHGSLIPGQNLHQIIKWRHHSISIVKYTETHKKAF